MAEKKANLGLASTEELIAELAARAHVAHTIGEQWPLYRTVSNEEAAASVRLDGETQVLDGHVHVYPQEWDYSIVPSGMKTCMDTNCDYTIYD